MARGYAMHQPAVLLGSSTDMLSKARRELTRLRDDVNIDTGVLSDPLTLTVEDDSAEDEQRFVTIGMNVFGTLMVVVHTARRDGPRFISVRKPDPKERRNYEEGL